MISAVVAASLISTLLNYNVTKVNILYILVQGLRPTCSYVLVNFHRIAQEQNLTLMYCLAWP